MADLFHKIGPVAVVSVIFTWVCWPYITGSATSLGGKGNGSSVSLPDNLLSPGVKDPNERDPFRAVKNAAINLIQKNMVGTAGTPSDNTNTEKEGTAGAPTNQNSSLTLTGIYIQGDRRMAILNGTVYQVGEKIKGEGNNRPWILQKVLHNKVVIAQGRKTRAIEMSFPSAPAHVEAPAPVETAMPATNKAPENNPLGGLSEILGKLSSGAGNANPRAKSVSSLEELFNAVSERKKQ